MLSRSRGSLSQYELKGVTEIEEASETGRGSYGFVFKVQLEGKVFVAKKPHRFFQECEQEERNRMAAKFEEECFLLSQLHHSNIVKFIGVYYTDATKKIGLALVMEKLNCDLLQFLANNSRCDLSLRLSILKDVACGLVYLHGSRPPVVHRDLTARNVLLTLNNQAKIADLGMAKLMDQRAMMATYHTQVPGQQYYMPPETFFERAECTSKVDIFSFGHLTLHLIIGEFPKVFDLPHHKKKEGIVEQQKRSQPLQSMGSSHSTYDLTIQCLMDDPNERPTASYLWKYLHLESRTKTKKNMPVNLDERGYLRGKCRAPRCDCSGYRRYSIDDHCDICLHSFGNHIIHSMPDFKTITLVKLATSEGMKVSTTFRDTWVKGKCPNISFIFSVVNTDLTRKWHRYKDSLRIQDVSKDFHGTTLGCDITRRQSLCNNTDCGVCGIARNGFDERRIREKSFSRFGRGFYMSPNSSKCHDYTQGISRYRAMLLLDVCPGKTYVLQTNNTTLTEPPPGHNSVYGKAGHSLNYDELVLYNSDGAVPKYIIVYQHDGIERIAKQCEVV